MSNLFSTNLDSNYDSISGGITFTGLGSGTDFDSIVDQLIEVESIQKNRMEVWKSGWQTKITSMTSLNQRLNALESAAKDMDTDGEFLVRQGTTSNSTVVTASGSSTATTGAYNITVGEDTVHMLRMAGGVDAATTDILDTDGDLVIVTTNENGAENTITVSLTDAGETTIQDVVDAINTAAAADGDDFEATLESDGTGSNSYYILLTSKNGGDSGRLEVTNNPLNFSFSDKSIEMRDDSGFSNTTSSISISGQFTGDKSTSSTFDYVFTFDGSGGDKVVGSEAFDITWDATADGGGSGTISVPADYVAGEELTVENGFTIRLGTGTVGDGESFTLRGFANNLDEWETVGTWDSTAGDVLTGGNYLGSVNKTYTIKVTAAGTIGAGADSGDPATLSWSDSTGSYGTITVESDQDYYTLDDGVTINFSTAGSLVTGDTFQINVFAPTLQQGQDAGLAQVAKVVHSGFTDSDTTTVAGNSDTFSYTYAGTEVTYYVNDNLTLSQLVNELNDDSNNPGVVFSIINDGMGTPTSHKMMMTGGQTGASFQITSVSHDFSSDFSTGGDVGGGFTTSQLATNSQIQVDGFPTGDTYLQRPDNTITDVVDGVTLNLVNAGAAKVTISINTNAVISKIEAFINAVNYAQDFIRQETKYDSDTGDSGILIGNYSYYILKSRIDSALNESISGLTDGVNTYTHLSQIGITTDPDDEGRWVIDSTELLDALNADPDAVAALFIQDDDDSVEGVAYRMAEEMEELTDPDDGMLNVLIANYNDIIDNIDRRIDREEKRLTAVRTRLEERFARLEASLVALNAQANAISSQIDALPSTSGN